MRWTTGAPVVLTWAVLAACFPQPPIVVADAGPLSSVDGGPLPTADAGPDGGAGIVCSDRGVCLTSETVTEDPDCACGAQTGEWLSPGRPGLRCYCFSIPAEAFSCQQDAECVRFHNTCGDCLEEPDIAVHRDWAGCLADYRQRYCASHHPAPSGYGNCCSVCPFDGPEYCPQVRCVSGRCAATVLSHCSVARDPSLPDFYFSPYPYTSPTIPGATCARQ